MDFELGFTLAVLAIALVLFVSDRVRLDIVAMGSLVALMLGGVLSVKEALAGFGAPLVVMIAALFIVGEGLARTGVARRAGASLGVLTPVSKGNSMSSTFTSATAPSGRSEANAV